MSRSSEYYGVLSDAVVAEVYRRAAHHSGKAAKFAARNDRSRWTLHMIQADFWTRLAPIASGASAQPATREQDAVLAWVTEQVAPKTARSAA